MSIHVSLICGWINFMPPLSCVLKKLFLLPIGTVCVGGGGRGGEGDTHSSVQQLQSS